jgi:hypothetical protein
MNFIPNGWVLANSTFEIVAQGLSEQGDCHPINAVQFGFRGRLYSRIKWLTRPEWGSVCANLCTDAV